jgi:hypothetical protein
MSRFRQYFSYRCKATLVRLLIFVGIALLLTYTSSYFLVYETFAYDYDLDTKYPVMEAAGDLSVLGWSAGICAVILPVLELLPFKNKRNIDTMLALPIGRGKMILAHYLCGLLHLSVTLFCSFALAAIKMVPYRMFFSLWMLLPFYAMLLLTAAILYSLFSFVFSTADTTADGIVWLHIYSLLPPLFLSSAYDAFHLRPWSLVEEPWYFSPFYHLFTVADKYNDYITPTIQYDISEGLDQIYSVSCTKLVFQDGEIFTLLLWVGLAAACLAGLVYFFRKQRPETVGGLSHSSFGYQSLIPLMALTLILAGLETALLMIFTVVWYIVYRRGFRFKTPDLVIMGLTLLASLLTNTGVSYL